MGRTGSFGWTSAVRGISELLVQAAIISKQGESECPRCAVEGERGSTAAALDAALAKQPAWLHDMFGSDSAGAAIFRRMVVRDNPELKRPGPVRVCLSAHWLKSLSVRVMVDDAEVFGLVELRSLLQALKSAPPAPRLIRRAAARSLPEEPPPFSLAEDITSEVRQMLWHTDIFSRESFVSGYRRLIARGHFRPGGDPRKDLVSASGLHLSELSKVGLAQHSNDIRRCIGERPLRVATGSAAFSSLVLFHFLRRSKALPIELDYSHTNTRELAWDIQRWSASSPPPEAIIVSISCASVLLSASRPSLFVPAMILPGNSHQVVATPGALKGSVPKQWLFITDEKTTSTFYFEELREAHARLSKDAISRVEQTELLRAAKSAESGVASILWYPHYRFQSLCNGNELSPLGAQTWDYTGNVLFLREDVAEDLSVPLNIALRDAWLELRARPDLTRELVVSLLSSDDYLRHLHRTSGLSFYPEWTYDALRGALQVPGAPGAPMQMTGG